MGVTYSQREDLPNKTKKNAKSQIVQGSSIRQEKRVNYSKSQEVVA